MYLLQHFLFILSMLLAGRIKSSLNIIYTKRKQISLNFPKQIVTMVKLIILTNNNSKNPFLALEQESSLDLEYLVKLSSCDIADVLLEYSQEEGITKEEQDMIEKISLINLPYCSCHPNSQNNEKP